MSSVPPQPPTNLGGGPAQPRPDPRPVRLELGPDERALKRERVIEVLWKLQEERGWIDDEAVKLAGAECDLTPIEVEEVASFYNLLLRRPAGRVKLFVCDSISCELLGASKLIAALAERLGVAPGEVTPDGQFSLIPIVCLGHCEKAPCALVGREVVGPVTPDAAGAAEILRRAPRG